MHMQLHQKQSHRKQWRHDSFPGYIRIKLSGVKALTGRALVREETGVISICKTILSGTPPEQIRDRTEGLDSAPLRDLAARLAADPNLTVSVITYSDGRQALEVLHTGPPHNTDDTIDHHRFARQTQEAPGWTLPVSTQAGLQDAVTMIRTLLLNAAVP
jgi:hypothetical protein